MKKFIFYLSIVLIISFIFCDSSFAAEQNVKRDITVLQDIQGQFKNLMEKTGGIINKYAVNLFIILAGIGFVAKFITDIMQKGEIDSKEVISYIIKFTLTTGFFFWLLNNGVKLGQDITSSMTTIGLSASGNYEKPTISGLVNAGFEVFGNLKFGFLDNPALGLVLFVLALLNFLFLIIMGVNLIIEEVSALILIYTGSFVLALGGMDYTRESAINFFKAVFAAGLRIFSLLIIISISIQIVSSSGEIASKKLSGMAGIYELLILLASTMILALLSMKIPDAIANLVSSAWGNMGGLTMISAVNMASNAASTIGGAVSKVATGPIGAAAAVASTVGKIATGVSDFNKNKEIGLQKAAALAAGDMTAKINPLFNKRKNGSGAAYQLGKLAAGSFDLAGKAGGKLGSIFGNSKEMSDITSNISDKEDLKTNKIGGDNPTTNNNTNNNINNNSANNSNPITNDTQNNSSSQNNTNNKSDINPEMDNKDSENKQTDTGDDFQKDSGEIKNASESKIDNGENNNENKN